MSDAPRPKSWEEYAELQPINEETLRSEPCQWERVQRVLDRCVGKVLDVGGGDGYIARALMDRGHEVTMIEPSRIRVDRARALGVDARLKDTLTWFGDQSYDTVLIGEVLEHLEDPGRLLRHAFEIARERVILTVPLRGWPDPTHVWRISIDHIAAPSPHRWHEPNQEQVVMTWQRGDCWPENFAKTDAGWRRQFEDGR